MWSTGHGSVMRQHGNDCAGDPGRGIVDKSASGSIQHMRWKIQVPREDDHGRHTSLREISGSGSSNVAALEMEDLAWAEDDGRRLAPE